MKRTQVRALTLAILLTLTLCLLPTVAGAVTLSKNRLEFTVGEYKDERFQWQFDDNEKFLNGFDLSGCDSKEYGLDACLKDEGEWISISGTPTKKGGYTGEIIIKVIKSDFTEETKTLFIEIVINEKQTPETPTPTPTPAPTPVDRPEIPDYSRCEQALIRGVKEWCNIRQRADINSDVTGRATLGQEISLICWNEDETWCYVDCDGEQGWIAKQFILPIK